MNKLMHVLVVLLGAAAAVRGAQIVDIQAAASYVPEAVEPGERVEIQISPDGDVPRTALSDVGEGQCRLVIVGSSSCPFSRRAAGRWATVALNDPEGTDMPPGWSTFWVVVEAPALAAALFEPGSPVDVWYASATPEEMARQGVIGVPYHLLLDADGRVVEAGMGALLPPMSAFRPDCTIDKTATESAINEGTTAFK